MSGFIKVSLRDENGIITTILHTNDLREFLGNSENIFKNDIKAEIFEKQVSKEYLFDKDYSKKDYKCPFDYGYIFIDRINKKLFYINNFSLISYYNSYDFDETEHNQIIKNNYKCSISKNNEYIEYDIREKYINLLSFHNYFKLNKALPFIKGIKNVNEDKYIDNIGFEEIINLLLNKIIINNSKLIIELIWRDWEVFDNVYTYENSLILYKYLKEEKLLNDLEDKEWQKILIDLSDKG